jgi:hypothetical protein
VSESQSEAEGSEPQPERRDLAQERWLTLVTRSGMLCADTGERRGL